MDPEETLFSSEFNKRLDGPLMASGIRVRAGWARPFRPSRLQTWPERTKPLPLLVDLSYAQLR
jgi:hypothetical protein